METNNPVIFKEHSRVSSHPFGTVNGKDVLLFTLLNKSGHKVCISNYGGTVTAWESADKNGELSHNIIGFDEPGTYFGDHPYFGSLVGRYANRIPHGHFLIGEKEYTVSINNGPHHLHGGFKGFDKVIWNAAVDEHGNLQLDYLSRDGEEGYPGNLQVNVTYSFTDEDELIIRYRAKTDAPTPVNLTNHCYFDLSGNNEPINDTQLLIKANLYTAVDNELIPTGELLPVQGTPLDFTSPKKIGDLLQPGFYDHNYVLDKKEDVFDHVATAIHARSGKQLEVFTTEPGLQFYTANGLDGSFRNRNGKPIQAQTAFCLETQHFPASPNHPHFPNSILYPGKLFESTTKYRITVV